jgi:hypothetical protein
VIEGLFKKTRTECEYISSGYTITKARKKAAADAPGTARHWSKVSRARLRVL